MLAGIGRHPAVAPPRRRAAARRDPLLELLRALRPEESLADARDHALLLVGWKAALRSDDLARLRMDDLHASEQGLSVFIARSKTDQTGHGTTLGIAAPAPRRRGRGARNRRCSTPVPPGSGGGTCSAPTASSTAPPGAASTATAADPAPAGCTATPSPRSSNAAPPRPGSRTPSCGAGTACAAGSPPKPSPPASPNATSNATAAGAPAPPWTPTSTPPAPSTPPTPPTGLPSSQSSSPPDRQGRGHRIKIVGDRSGRRRSRECAACRANAAGSEPRWPETTIRPAALPAFPGVRDRVIAGEVDAVIV